MASSSSKWTIDPSTLGMSSIDQLVLTPLPSWSDLAAFLKLAMPQPPGYAPKNVDDFSPNFDDNGNGILNIVPFSELNDIIKDGDIVVFMEPKTNFDIEQLIKQRGWHAEIAFRNSSGIAVQCGPYGGECKIQEYECTEICTNQRFGVTRRNLHIFRVSESSGADGQISRLLKGVRLWRTVYENYNFPSGDKWFLDPADFGTVAELEHIARELILSEPVPDMYCMQWVHAVLSLALNVPLNHRTLSRLGLLQAYEQRWPQLGFVDEDVMPLGRLPIVPYSPSDHVLALCTLYLGMSDSVARSMLPTLLQTSAIQDVLLGVPPRSVPPILPFSEYRKPAHTGMVMWEYVATTFADFQCRLK